MKIIGHIPARLGSVRVKKKNLRDLCGKPMIAYAIEAATGSKLLDEIYVNTESELIGNVGIQYGARFYKRKPELADDHATQDQFNYDFIVNTGADVVVLVNPVAPLIISEDIDNIIKYLIDHDFDTVIPVKEEHVHAFFNNKSVNFDINGQLEKTQNLTPIQLCVWTVCVWKTYAFTSEYEKNGHACFVGKVGYYPMDPLRSVKVSYESDFQIAEALLSRRKN